ncbi:phosphoenolpyruvate carboxykinase [soil metagenome]
MADFTGDSEPTLRLPLVNAIVNATPAVLYEHAIRRDEATVAHGGPLVADTGKFTGRSPKDKYVVRDDFTEDVVDWGPINQAMTPEHFGRLQEDMFDAAAERQLFVQELFAGTDPAVQIPVRIVTERAWHSLFVRNLFVRSGDPAAGDRLGWTVLDLPSFKADSARHGCRSSTCIAVDFGKRLVLIANSEYAGEMKKSIFGALNFALPHAGILPMHCSANVGAGGDVALFFGLSGTGKTTLSADAKRTLIGDDEHGWSDDGIFNFEGGCYAKAIKLSRDAEPEIYEASTRFGAVLENVVIDDDTRVIDFDDARKTENTRSAYPLDFIPNASDTGRAGHPDTVVFLTADAFGVLPPISRLDTHQAMYHFLSGYTAKVAGTERGVTEPQATFSACFGSPFMPLPPARYAEMLGERLAQHGSRVWLVNTGWTGGPYGKGSRIKLAHTRALIDAALAGDLDDIETRIDPIFAVAVPVRVPNVPDDLLDPRRTWGDAAAYDAQAKRLAGMFAENFARFSADVARPIVDAGPRT